MKRRWIELLGPQRIFEFYGSQEQVGLFYCRGDEWLQRPGSVGRPIDCEVRIADDAGRAVPTGQIGHVFLRNTTSHAPQFLGAGAELWRTEDGLVCVGDDGWVDECGYLYLAGRCSDVIDVSGVNVYPAEVEHVLLAAPGVRDAMVVGKPHPDLGEAVHARIVPTDAEQPPAVAGLRRHCRERLSSHKRPLSYEIVDRIERSETGKLVRRSGC